MHWICFHLELQLATTSERWPRPSPYAALAASRLDAAFQVDVHRYGFLDRTLLEPTARSGRAPSDSPSLGESWRLAGELVYTPLVVGRAGRDEESDGLFNARALLAYRLR